MAGLKNCVFCGQKPIAKNREHVLPLWLIEMTGDKNRKGRFGLRFENAGAGPKLNEFAFSHFRFPACKSCNTEFGVVESQVKNVFERLLEFKALSSSDCELLLDWFDKIRIGLWLGLLMTSNNPLGVNPKFPINGRIGTADRMLLISAVRDESKILKGLMNVGVGTNLFHMQPSAFGLLVNNFFFLNISTQFLISNRLGFPYPREVELLPNNEPFLYHVSSGTGKTRLPLLQLRLPFEHGSLCQAIYEPTLSENNKHHYETELVHSLVNDTNCGRTAVLTEESNISIVHTLDDSFYSRCSVSDPELFFRSFTQAVLEAQLIASKNWPTFRNLSKDERTRRNARLKLARDANEQLLAGYRSAARRR